MIPVGEGTNGQGGGRPPPPGNSPGRASLWKPSLLSAKPVRSPATSLFANPEPSPLGASHCPTTLALALTICWGDGSGPQTPSPAFHAQSERTPHPAGWRCECPSRPCSPQEPPRGCPSPGPQRARAPDPLPQIRDAAGAALTDQEGGRGPARQRRGWGGGGERGSAAPDPECLGARPGGGRSPGAPAPADARGGTREAGAVRRRGRSRRFAAGSRLRWALSCSQRRLRWRARPAVTSARLPRPPLLTPTSAGRRGAEASGAGRSARLPGASFPSPRASSLSRGVAAPWEPSVPRAMPGSPGATATSLGGGGERRLGSLAGRSRLRDPGCFGENGEVTGLGGGGAGVHALGCRSAR